MEFHVELMEIRLTRWVENGIVSYRIVSYRVVLIDELVWLTTVLLFVFNCLIA